MIIAKIMFNRPHPKFYGMLGAIVPMTSLTIVDGCHVRLKVPDKLETLRFEIDEIRSITILPPIKGIDQYE